MGARLYGSEPAQPKRNRVKAPRTVGLREYHGDWLVRSIGARLLVR
jgi:hypothetical protein